jgi:hypothetical protein
MRRRVLPVIALHLFEYLDGTLLNRESTISDYTSETLKLTLKELLGFERVICFGDPNHLAAANPFCTASLC